jgi:DNA polymerase sigma
MASRLNVESPLDPTEDVASGAFNYIHAKNHFKLAYEILYA